MVSVIPKWETHGNHPSCHKKALAIYINNCIVIGYIYSDAEASIHWPVLIRPSGTYGFHLNANTGLARQCFSQHTFLVLGRTKHVLL